MSSDTPSIARAAALRGGRVRFRAVLRAAAPLAATIATAALALCVPAAPWPLVAVLFGALVGVWCGAAPRRNEPALTLGFGLVGLEVRFDELASAGSVVLLAPLLFWVLLALGQTAARALTLVDGRGAGLVALGLSGSGLPPLLVAAQRDRAVSTVHTSTALVVVVASGVLAALVLPPLGALLQLNHTDLGLWLGIVVSQTTQARASAALVSPEAVAMVASTKLVLLAVQGVPLLAYLAAARAILTNAAGERQAAHAVGFAVVRALLPRHALAFVATALVAAAIELPSAVLDTSGAVVTVCFVHLLTTAGRDLGANGRAGFPWRAVTSGVVVWFLAAAGLAAALAATNSTARLHGSAAVDLDPRAAAHVAHAHTSAPEPSSAADIAAFEERARGNEKYVRACLDSESAHLRGTRELDLTAGLGFTSLRPPNAARTLGRSTCSPPLSRHKASCVKSPTFPRRAHESPRVRCEIPSVGGSEDEAVGLKRAWERRARSPLREFLVASDADFEDEAAASAQALLDLAGLFLGHAAGEIGPWRVLEIGCGSGRLAKHIAPRVASYAGVDIAPTTVEHARRRCAGTTARFLVGDGRGVPPELASERFDFVFSWAVMIHVPRELALLNMASAWEHVAPGGELRFNFRADASDLEPLDDFHALLGDRSAFEPPPQRVVHVPQDAARLAALAQLLEREPGEPSYMGHAFTRAELTRVVERLAGGSGRIVRPHRDHVHAIVRREALQGVAGAQASDGGA